MIACHHTARYSLVLIIFAGLLVVTTSLHAIQQVGLEIEGHAVPYLVSPTGEASGMGSMGAQINTGIPGSKVDSSATSVGITLIAPTTGVYNLSLTGPYPETLKLDLGFYDSATDEEYTRSYRVLYQGGTLSLTFLIDPNQEPVIDLQSNAGDPVIASVSLNGNGSVVLSWLASLDNDVVKYRVYKRVVSVPVFQQVAELTTLSFDTGDQLQGVSGQRMLYTVVAVTAGGEESLVDQVLANEISVIAAFQVDNTSLIAPATVQFTDVSFGEPSQWVWDFDSDGVIDSTVQNPSHTFNTPGKYSITLSIDSPFGQDTRTVVDYIEVHEGSDTDTDGIGDGVDNCSQVANPNQRDTDGDGFGNYCDGDFNNDLIVNGLDLGTFRQKYFTTDPDGDFNGDGIVNGLDLGLFRQMYFLPPGPGAVVP